MKRRYVALIAAVVVLAIVIAFLVPAVSIWPVQAEVRAKGEALASTPVTDRIDFGAVPQGATTTRTISLSNAGKVPNNVRVFIFGSVSDMVKIEPESFTLERGEKRDVSFQLTVPDSAPPGKKLTGRVVMVHLPKRLW